MTYQITNPEESSRIARLADYVNLLGEYFGEGTLWNGIYDRTLSLWEKRVETKEVFFFELAHSQQMNVLSDVASALIESGNFNVIRHPPARGQQDQGSD